MRAKARTVNFNTHNLYDKRDNMRKIIHQTEPKKVVRALQIGILEDSRNKST